MSTITEEEIFANDIDPLDAIREIRKEEGVDEDELPESSVDDTSSVEADKEHEKDGEDELDNLDDKGDAIKDDTSQLEGEDDIDINKDSEFDDDISKDVINEDKDYEPEEIVRKFTANGKEFEFTQAEIMEQFEVVFGQAMDYTQKTQKLAPYRKMISALETENISPEQLNVAIDALKGNPQALQTLMETNKIDAFEIANKEKDESDPYKPTEYGKDEKQLSIDEIIDNISGDVEYKITVDVIDRQWDDSSRNALSSNPGMIQGLHNDIKSGVYDKVAPVAMKMKLYDGNTKSDLEYYMLAGEKVLDAEKQTSEKSEKAVSDTNKNTQDTEDKFDQASSEAQRKRSASPTRTRADRKGAIDYLDDGDEDYDAWYKKLMASN